MENSSIDLLKEIACHGFCEPGTLQQSAEKISSSAGGGLCFSRVKPEYYINVERNGNGDLLISGRDFGNTQVIITQKEQMQYAAYMCELIEKNKGIISEAIQSHEGDKLEEVIYNTLTGKNEQTTSLGSSENTLADAISTANSVKSTISKIHKVNNDEYVTNSTQAIDTFFSTFEEAEKGLSSSNTPHFWKIIKEAYDEYSDYGQLNYRFELDNTLSTDNIHNRIRKFKNKKTDDILLKECIGAIGRTRCNGELFSLVKKYINGEKDEAHTGAEGIKTKLKTAPEDVKSANTNDGEQIAEQSLRNLYIASSLNTIYKAISCCKHPEMYDFGHKEALEEVAQISPKNPLEELNNNTENIARQTKDVLDRSQKYMINPNSSSGNIEGHNYRTAGRRMYASDIAYAMIQNRVY